MTNIYYRRNFLPMNFFTDGFFTDKVEKDMFGSSHRRCSVTKGVLRNFAKFTGKPLCQSLFFNKVADLRPETLFKKRLRHRCFPEVCNVIKKETLAQGFSSEFCGISKNTFCYRTTPVAVSVCCRRKGYLVTLNT